MKDYLKVRCKVRREGKTPPFALSAPKCETSSRKKLQKQNSTLGRIEEEGVNSIKYLSTLFKK